MIKSLAAISLTSCFHRLERADLARPVIHVFRHGLLRRAGFFNLVEKLNPREIRALVLAKTINKEDKKSNTKQSLH